MVPIRDIYDALPPERGAALRRANLERLAELEAASTERRTRMFAAALRSSTDGDSLDPRE